jgi:hypothetical protein
MQKIIISAVSIMIAGMVVIYFIHATHNRFDLVIGADGKMYELDRRNGDSWLIDDSKRVPLENPETPRPRMREQEMTKFELKDFSIEGRLNNGTLLGKIYNGSGTPITRVVMTVTAKELNGKVRWTRDFSETMFIKPMTTGRFAIGVTNSDGIGDVVFTLSKAYTRPMIESSPAGR